MSLQNRVADITVVDPSEYPMSDETDDPVEAARAFAADLRTLRLRCESPTLAKIQHDSGISRSVISNALAGRQLPSARTVDRLVRALGEDAAPWVLRRDSIANAGGAASAATPEPVEVHSASGAGPWWTVRVLGRRTVVLAGATFVLGFALALSATCLVGGTVSPQPRTLRARV